MKLLHFYKNSCVFSELYLPISHPTYMYTHYIFKTDSVITIQLIRMESVFTVAILKTGTLS